MLRSEQRILTTHSGSLPRSAALVKMLARRSTGGKVDPKRLSREIEHSTRHVVESQLAAGIDVGNNGEQPRESFFTYVQHRMSGFSGHSPRPLMKDIGYFKSYRDLMLGQLSRRHSLVNLMSAPMATGDVKYTDTAELEKESADYRRILSTMTTPFAESFMTAPSPGIIASAMMNAHYPDYRDYVFALGAALKTEYDYIVAQGFVLQVDCPDLAMERHTSYADRPLNEFLDYVGLNIAAMNQGLADVPRDRVRMHVCWGNYEAPHIFDVALDDILSRLYEARVGALNIEMANPRHAHEHRCFVRNPLPSDMNLVVGVIDTKTNYVEHPELIADRIAAAAEAVGDPHRVMAGTDCGFETSAGLGMVAEEIVWEKLKALRAGADLASQRLLH